jgi:putative DNA primase/helicase
VFGGDQDMIAFIQRAAGYSLTGLASEQALFLAYGHGANGKSTFLEVLSLLAGDFHAAGSFDSFDVNERNAKRDDLAALVGKRLLTIVESDEDRRLSGAKVKSVTGNDPISCRHLHGKYFTYTPTFKPWFATNFKPMISDDTDGMWRRVRLIPFPHSFAGAPDRQLSAKLRGELPGILTWAVEGARLWYAQGLGSCKTVDAATADYRADSDILGQWIEECCTLGPNEVLDAGTGYHSYKVWAQQNGYFVQANNVMSAQAWGRRMGERPGITKRRRVYYGIGSVVPVSTP